MTAAIEDRLRQPPIAESEELEEVRDETVIRSLGYID